jgi:AraC-like DNA-binding protein
MNIHYREFQPSAPLQPFVDCYWYHEFEAGAYEDSPIQRCLPFGMTELIFVDGRCEVCCNGRWELLPTAFIAGVYKDVVTWKCVGPTAKFGIRLKPESLLSLFNVPAGTLFSSFADLPSVFGSYIKELTEKVGEANALPQYIRIAEDFLSRLLMQSTQPRTYVTEASEIIRKTDGTISIATLSNQLNISRRQLERGFRDTFGTSPKTYTRIIRFRNTYSYLLSNKAASVWTDAAYNFGYADQAHFIKEFKTFAGTPPTGMIYKSEEFFQSKGEKCNVELLFN